jgi:cytoskeleton protein RodZ
VLEVRALDTAWLEYSSDAGATKIAVLNAGDKIRIRARKSIRIRSGNAGGIELYLNGVKQAPLGDPGAVRERRIELK